MKTKTEKNESYKDEGYVSYVLACISGLILTFGGSILPTIPSSILFESPWLIVFLVLFIIGFGPSFKNAYVRGPAKYYWYSFILNVVLILILFNL